MAVANVLAYYGNNNGRKNLSIQYMFQGRYFKKQIHMYRLHSKLVCFSMPMKETDNSKITLAYYIICPFYVNYKSVKLYTTGFSLFRGAFS